MAAKKSTVKAPVGTTRVGRRKTSIARVRVISGTGKLLVNGRDAKSYFTIPRHYQAAIEGLTLTGLTEKFDIHVLVHGGGMSGQAGAVRLGVARVLQTDNPALRPDLKKAGLLRRDPRMVERKKYGLHKARRGTQFSKR